MFGSIFERWKRLPEGAQRAQQRRHAVDAFDPAFLARLARVRLRRGRVMGDRPGETAVRGRTSPSGIELESFQPYTPGDDIRHVDWVTYARLEQLFTRRFVAEREIPVHVLLDTSASMGRPASDDKFGFGCGLAAALTWIGLNAGDAIRVAAIGGSGTDVRVRESRVLRHRGRFLGLQEYLDELEPAGETALAEGVLQYVARHRERGIAFLVSDFLVPPEDYRQALLALREARLEVRALHVVGRNEASAADLRGHLRLRDSESGEVREVAVSASERQRYREAFAARGDELRAFCHGAGLGYARADAGGGLAGFFLEDLAASGEAEVA